MEARDVVLKSAEATASLVGTQDFFTLTKSTLSFTSDELCRHLRPQDGPCLYLPMELFVDGKYRQGVLLALSGRAVLVWVIGTFRMKAHAVTIPVAEVASIDTTSEPGRGLKTGREKLTIVTPTASWSMQFFANVFEGGRNVLPFVGPALHGGVTPEFDRGSTA